MIWQDAIADSQGTLLHAKVHALMRAYDQHFADCGWAAESVEQQFHVPIVNPETRRSSNLYNQAGKFDGILAGGYLLEHKTTSTDIADPASTYWRRLHIDHQVSSYMLAAWQLGEKLNGTLYNVLRKPLIRPKRLEKAAVAKIASLREYCGQCVPDDIVAKVVGGQADECPELYGMRLYSEVRDNPGRYFQQRMIARTDRDMLDWATELWAVSREMHKAKPFRNPNACLSYNRPCEYLGVCSGYDSPGSQNWRLATCVHDELDLPDDGRCTLTYSRMSCYLTCREKHRLRYILGLRRVKEEDGEDEEEALRFGSLWHSAQAAWWKSRGVTHD